MEQEGYISKSEKEQAKQEEIVLQEQMKDDDYAGKYPYYVDHIMDEAMKKYKLTKNEILSGGLHIFTELNPESKLRPKKYIKMIIFSQRASQTSCSKVGLFLLTLKMAG